MIKWIKRLFCRHEWEIRRKTESFVWIIGKEPYKICTKCGKVEKWYFRQYEGGGYK